MSSAFDAIMKPAPLQDGVSLYDYWVAPSGEGELAATWQDKPHRLLYDLIAYARHLEDQNASLRGPGCHGQDAAL